MSLTSFLEQADVRTKFKELFPKPEFIVQAPLLVPAKSKNFSLIGTAFDYLLRFHLQYWLSLPPQRPWVAHNALKRIVETQDRRLIVYAHSVLELAQKFHVDFLATGSCNHNLLYTCLKLAKFDAVFRAAHVTPRLILENEAKEDANELLQLIQAVPPSLFQNAKFCFLNPTFNEASKMICGADADLILDDVLIEIKTTKKLELSQEHFHQLMGYYTLYRIGGISNDTQSSEINQIGIYFSRYSCFYKLEVKQLFDEIEFESFLGWFIQRASNDCEKDAEP